MAATMEAPIPAPTKDSMPESVKDQTKEVHPERLRQAVETANAVLTIVKEKAFDNRPIAACIICQNSVL